MRARTVASIICVLALAACGTTSGGSAEPRLDDATTRSTSATPSSPTAASKTSPSTPAAPSPASLSAADDLAPFLAKAQRVDQRLRAAAVKINGAIGTTKTVVDQATADAVKAADPQTVSAAIPAGLPPRLLNSVLTVYSALATRRAAMGYFASPGTWLSQGPPDTWPSEADVLGCLRNGTAAAAHFDAYLADLRAQARSLPSRPAAAPSSRAAAELAAIVEWVDLTYNGCDSCGGPVITRAPSIDWGAAPGTAPTAHGWVGGIEFTATYTSADGWQAELNAC